MVAKLYYKWKLKIPLENLKNGMYHISQQDLDFRYNTHLMMSWGSYVSTFEHMKMRFTKAIVKCGICFKRESADGFCFTRFKNADHGAQWLS